MSKKQAEEGIEVVVSESSGLRVYGTPVIDTLGNKAIVHESSVPKQEGGPFLWVTLQKAGETEGVGVLLDQAQAQDLRDRIDAGMNVWGK